MFDQWNVEKAKKAIPDQNTQWLRANLAYYQGDHWQNGAGWAGPALQDGHELHEFTLRQLERKFVSKNEIRRVVATHTAGIAGKLPYWEIVLDGINEDNLEQAQNSALVKEATQLITYWLNRAQGITMRQDSSSLKLCAAHEVVQLAVESALVAKRGALRLFIAPSAVNEDGTSATGSSLQDALRHIFVQHPPAAQSCVHVDPDTMNRVGLYVYKKDQDEFVELSYLDDAEDTVVRIIGNETAAAEMTLPLHGRLTIHEMERPLFVTAQMRQLQAALNKALTMQSVNIDSGGFLERIMLNAQMPGKVETDPKTGQPRFVPDPIRVGPGTTNFFVGVEVEQPDGSTRLASPQAIFRDPTDPTPFVVAERNYTKAILEEANQSHLMLAAEAAPSGESRTQAKDGFKMSLLITQPAVEAAWRWMLETVLALAAALAGQPNHFRPIRVNVQVQPDLGVVTQDEKLTTINARAARLISQETALREYGVADPLAEIQRLEEEGERPTAQDA